MKINLKSYSYKFPKRKGSWEITQKKNANPQTRKSLKIDIPRSLHSNQMLRKNYYDKVIKSKLIVFFLNKNT